MASSTIAYVAVSLDGYLASEDGSVDFLSEFGSDEFDFHGFFGTVGAVAMGSATYEQILGWGWPYGDTPGLVLTTRDLDAAEGVDITFSSRPTGEALAAYAAGIDSRLWVVGGGVVITEGINAGAIDTLEIYLMPKVLGSGIPMFTAPLDRPLTLTETTTFSTGVVKLLYSVG